MLNEEQPPTVADQVGRLRRTFESGRSRPETFRRQQLQGLIAMLQEKESDFVDALAQDLHKPPCETFISETDFVVNEARHALDELGHWLAPETISTNIMNQLGSSTIRREPLGVALVLAPWNFPLQLALNPMVAAVAAGNCVLLKPSELAPATAAALAQHLPNYLDQACTAVVVGGVDTATALLRQRFDKIFFTGGARVARVVMRAAAEHLTPVTLELGGKNPCLVDDKVDLKVAARRIAWGKTFNGGQACVAVDYILVHRRRHDELIAAIKTEWGRFYGDKPEESPDLCHIVNDAHFARLCALLQSGEVYCGGKSVAETRCITPTILTQITLDMPVMQEEIFGPILPVLAVDSMEEAIEIVNSKPPALALYLFSKRSTVQEQVLSGTHSGDVCINDVIAHYAVPELPFGGRGESGMGAYHGRHGFEAFSQLRGVLRKSTLIDPGFRYPPYSKMRTTLFRKVLALG